MTSEIRCPACGSTEMKGTGKHPPKDSELWRCQDCGTEEAIHVLAYHAQKRDDNDDE